MEVSKLKPDNSLTAFVPAAIALVLMGTVSAIFGLDKGLNTMGVLLIFYGFLFSFWSFVRTSNKYFLVSFSYLLAAGAFVIILEPGMLKTYGGRLSSSAMILFTLTIILWLWVALLFFTKRLKWRGREFMELVAQDVPEGSDSYSERPRPAGILDGSKENITGFTNYLISSLIFISYQEGEKLYLVPVKMGREYKYLFNNHIDLTNTSWISIAENGELATHVSHQDYLDYRQNLSFDMLGEAMGSTLQHFFELYLRREEVRILDEIGQTKVGLLS